MGQRWKPEQITNLHIARQSPFDIQDAGRHNLQLEALQLRDGSPLTMPAVMLSNGRQRPRMVLVAGQHGDEWNGPWVLHQLATTLNPEEVLGTILILPFANPLALYEARRVSAVDNIDLNRTYVSPSSRKPTEHLGDLLWKSIFSSADFLIDLHSGGPGEYLPFVAAPNGKDFELARALNLPFIQLPERTKAGFLVDACHQAGIRAVLVEFGGGRSLDRQHHRPVLDGLLNLLRSVDMLAGNPTSGEEPYVFRQKEIVSAPSAGFLDLAVELGQRVHKGELIGTITPILAETCIEVRSPREGIVIYLRRDLSVAEYDSLIHIV